MTREASSTKARLRSTYYGTIRITAFCYEEKHESHDVVLNDQALNE